MKICTRCYELKEMYHGRNCRDCRKKYLSFIAKEKQKKTCPICKNDHYELTIECCSKCKILNRHKVVNGCWEWQGKINNCGYGCFQEIVNEKKTEVRAHRKSFELFKGEIPDDKIVCHSCDNPSCCNPEHLWLGTPKENTQDSFKKNRRPTTRQRAIAASKLTEEIVIEIRKAYKNGYRQKEIKEMFKITQAQVQSIVNFKTWKHLD